MAAEAVSARDPGKRLLPPPRVVVQPWYIISALLDAAISVRAFVSACVRLLFWSFSLLLLRLLLIVSDAGEQFVALSCALFFFFRSRCLVTIFFSVVVVLYGYPPPPLASPRRAFVACYHS